MTRTQIEELVKFNHEAVVELRSKGFKLNEIQQKLNISMQQVKYILYEKSPKVIKPIKRNKPVPSIPKNLSDRITVLTNFGYTPCEISEDLSIPKGKVIRYIAHLFHTNQITKRV